MGIAGSAIKKEAASAAKVRLLLLLLLLLASPSPSGEATAVGGAKIVQDIRTRWDRGGEYTDPVPIWGGSSSAGSAAPPAAPADAAPLPLLRLLLLLLLLLLPLPALPLHSSMLSQSPPVSAGLFTTEGGTNPPSCALCRAAAMLTATPGVALGRKRRGAAQVPEMAPGRPGSRGAASDSSGVSWRGSKVLTRVLEAEEEEEEEEEEAREGVLGGMSAAAADAAAAAADGVREVEDSLAAAAVFAAVAAAAERGVTGTSSTA
jgi:hypothetical protein